MLLSVGTIVSGSGVLSLINMKSGFDFGSAHVSFVVDEVALGHVLLLSTLVFPLHFPSTNAPHSFNNILIRNTSGRSLGNIKEMFFQMSGTVKQESNCVYIQL
jgi:hypothetical protein